MKPDQIQRALSAYVDGELSASDITEIEEILASSQEARSYLAQLRSLRAELRDELADVAPDVTQRVVASIQSQGRQRAPRRVGLAAAFAAGVVAGAVFIGIALREPSPVAAADIPDEVVAAQSRVTSLTARLDIVERGWHPDVVERVFSGSIEYRAPESLLIELVDETDYPEGPWVPNDVTLVVDEDVAWSLAVAACPTGALPGCTPREPRASILSDREPFPDASPAPLDLIVPAASFSRAGEPVSLGVAELDGRTAVGVEVTAAQVAAVLDGLATTGNWREIHPTDRVELWLDDRSLVPLGLSVFPAGTPDRALWAIRHGYRDRAETPILEVRWSDVDLRGEGPIRFPTPPDQGSQPSAGFTDGSSLDSAVPLPEALPEGMTLHRSGVIATGKGPEVSVASWSDGRAWLKVRSTDDWDGDHLFGDLGSLVREVPLGLGIAYLNERGDRVAIHAEDIDLVVVGSLPADSLLRVAESIGLTGLNVPTTWAEAASSSLEAARDQVPGLLSPPQLDGFDPPAIHTGPGVAVFSYAGAGNRAFLLTQTTDNELSPPLEANVRGVVFRGVNGRYSPERGALEWSEGAVGVTLLSTSLTLEELVVIAEALG